MSDKAREIQSGHYPTVHSIDSVILCALSMLVNKILENLEINFAFTFQIPHLRENNFYLPTSQEYYLPKLSGIKE